MTSSDATRSQDVQAQSRKIYATVKTIAGTQPPRAIRFDGQTFSELRARLMAANLPGAAEDSFLELRDDGGEFVCLLDQDQLPEGDLYVNVHNYSAGLAWQKAATPMKPHSPPPAPGFGPKAHPAWTGGPHASRQRAFNLCDEVPQAGPHKRRHGPWGGPFAFPPRFCRVGPTWEDEMPKPAKDFPDPSPHEDVHHHPHKRGPHHEHKHRHDDREWPGLRFARHMPGPGHAFGRHWCDDHGPWHFDYSSGEVSDGGHGKCGHSHKMKPHHGPHGRRGCPGRFGGHHRHGRGLGLHMRHRGPCRGRSTSPCGRRARRGQTLCNLGDLNPAFEGMTLECEVYEGHTSDEAPAGEMRERNTAHVAGDDLPSLVESGHEEDWHEVV